MVLCACGCGQEIEIKTWHKYRNIKYIHGHNSFGNKSRTGMTSLFKGKKHTKEANEQNRIKHLGKVLSKESIRKRTETRRKNGWFKDRDAAIKKLRNDRLGKKGCNWKGGITPERLKIWKSPEYKKWRLKVFERNNYTCQISGQVGGELVAHHLDNFAEFKDKRMDVSNGITLSKNVHMLFHTIYGSNHNTKEQFIEFKKII